jgi:hypothetical protein
VGECEGIFEKLEARTVAGEERKTPTAHI